MARPADVLRKDPFVKVLQAIVLILAILIMLPVAASVVGISLLAIGVGTAVNEVLTVEPTTMPDASLPAPATRRPAPTTDPRMRPAEDAALARFDDARARELAECEVAAGDDVEALDRCIEVDNRREDERTFMADCFNYVAKTLADVIRCEADHAIHP